MPKLGVFKVAILMVACLWASFALAADQPQYGPPEAWVRLTPVPATAPTNDGTAVQVLLQVNQTRFDDAGDEFYTEVAFRISTPQGLGLIAALAPTWNPETESLTYHRLNVIRGSQTLDLLGGGKKVTVLRREQNLELAILDGRLTATVQPEGVQVGDIVDFAVTLHRRDPVYQGRSEGFSGLPFVGPVGHVVVRQLWPATKPMLWRKTDGFPQPIVQRGPDRVELGVDAISVRAPKPPADAPARFQLLGQLQLSQFQNWSDVSALMAPLYTKAMKLTPDSPLNLEIQRISHASTDPKIRAAAALRLVQDQVRYAFVGMNLGGYVPAVADTTWARRFGDCKGKTTLLLALLNGLGIEAEPALVSTVLGDGLDEHLPMLSVFDHVLVRARIGGRVYWLDGSRSGDREIDDIQVPDFHWALAVRPSGAQIERLEPVALAQPAFESLLRLDASAGLDSLATAHAEQVFRGDAAVAENLLLSGVGRADAERSLREYWRGFKPWIDVKSVEFSFDDPHRVLRLSMDGLATMDWTKGDAERDFDIGDSSLGMRASFAREPGLHVDAPFTVPFPEFRKWTVVIKLPPGSAFSLLSAADVDRTIAGHHYERHSRIGDGQVTMVASERTLAPEFPASEASAAETTLRQLADYDVTVRASGPSGTTRAEEPLDIPTDAPGFSARGAVFLDKRDLGRAIADFDQAIRLDPRVAKYFYNRGVAHFEKRQDELALADFSRALQLNPMDAFARQGRAELYLFRGDDAQANKDLDQAASLGHGDREILSRNAVIYDNAGRYASAVRIYDQLIAQAPNSNLYGARCWARAEWGHELERALADCDAAIKTAPGRANLLDSRGLVHLRLGKFDEAVRDYDAALSLDPQHVQSFFGRGIAKSRKGAKQEGLSDIAKARSLDPNVEATFARSGITP
jgi:tetratricopeptide (TPR) repeat protein